jgi:hypothetical protein
MTTTTIHWLRDIPVEVRSARGLSQRTDKVYGVYTIDHEIGRIVHTWGRDERDGHDRIAHFWLILDPRERPLGIGWAPTRREAVVALLTLTEAKHPGVR